MGKAEHQIYDPGGSKTVILVANTSSVEPLEFLRENECFTCKIPGPVSTFTFWRVPIAGEEPDPELYEKQTLTYYYPKFQTHK